MLVRTRGFEKKIKRALSISNRVALYFLAIAVLRGGFGRGLRLRAPLYFFAEIGLCAGAPGKKNAPNCENRP